MNIAAGMTALRTGIDLTRTLRDALKAGTIKGDEIAGRIGEIYDYIVDSKDALVDAKDEIETLKSELRLLKDEKSLADSLEHDGTAYWIRKGEKWDGPFCSPCWDETEKLVRLQDDQGSGTHPSLFMLMCPVKHGFITVKRRPRIID